MSVVLPPALAWLLQLTRRSDPSGVASYDLRQWDSLVRLARTANLLGSVADVLAGRGVLDLVPEGPRIHLQSALALARQQSVSVRWEAFKIGAALEGLRERLVLLKGAAYLAEGLPFAGGRMFSDVDILVPQASMDRVEAALSGDGWATVHHTEYDQTYYRRWMHEIPPMRHLERGTVVDVHHRILPRTARFAPDPARMLERAKPSRNWPGVFVLCPEDMLLHSATHLYHEGELDNGWRDLLDIDGLVNHYSPDPDFWHSLERRGEELGLQEPLGVILRQASALLGTAVPARLLAGGRAWLDRVYSRALLPRHALCHAPAAGAARWVVYVRSHALRMPPHLLAYHLSRKALRRWFEPEDEQAA